MKDEVIDNIFQVYSNKLRILKDETRNVFMHIMRVSMFRRCVENEEIEDIERPNISLVYSGQLGCRIAYIKKYLSQDYLFYIEEGSELCHRA